MKFLKILCFCLLIGLTVYAQRPGRSYFNMSDSRLPVADLGGLTMDASLYDLDGDGDLDIMLANEHKPNILLINDGKARFSNESKERIPQIPHDSEEVAIADFDGDGDPDIIVVSEDDQVKEYYLNDGKGYFEDVGNRLQFKGTSNCVAVFDFNNDF